MQKNRVVAWILHLCATIVAMLLATFLAIAISSNRVVGVGWGVPIGMILGYVIPAMFRNRRIVEVLAGTLLYSLITFLALYLESSNHGHVPFGDTGFIVMLIGVLIGAFELSEFILNMLGRMWAGRHSVEFSRVSASQRADDFVESSEQPEQER